MCKKLIIQLFIYLQMKKLYPNSEDDDSNYDSKQDQYSDQYYQSQQKIEIPPEAEQAFQQLEDMIDVKPDPRTKIDTKTKTSSELLSTCYKFRLISKKKYYHLKNKENISQLYKNHPKLSRILIQKFPNWFYLSDGKLQLYFRKERIALDKIYKIDYLNQFIQNGGQIIQIPSSPLKKYESSQIYFSSDDERIIRSKLPGSNYKLKKIQKSKVQKKNIKINKKKNIVKKIKKMQIKQNLYQSQLDEKYQDQGESSTVYMIIQ